MTILRFYSIFFALHNEGEAHYSKTGRPPLKLIIKAWCFPGLKCHNFVFGHTRVRAARAARMFLFIQPIISPIVSRWRQDYWRHLLCNNFSIISRL